MSAAIFDGIAAGLKADPSSIAKSANGVFQFSLSKPATIGGRLQDDEVKPGVEGGEGGRDARRATPTSSRWRRASSTSMQAFTSGELQDKEQMIAKLAVEIDVRARSAHARVRPSLRRQHGARPATGRAHRQAAKKHAGKAAPAAAQSPAASSSGGGGGRHPRRTGCSTAIFETAARG